MCVIIFYIVSSRAVVFSVIQKSYDYAANFAKIKICLAVMDLRSVFDKQGDLSEFEIASLVNLFPRTPDEAKVSLKYYKMLYILLLLRIKMASEVSFFVFTISV